MLEPLVKNKLGQLDDEPPVVPNVNVRVTLMAAENPPFPVQVKLVTVSILNTVVAAVVFVRYI